MSAGTSYWLPRSKVVVCLKPGEKLTDEEVQALDEYFLLIGEVRQKGTSKPLP